MRIIFLILPLLFCFCFTGAASAMDSASSQAIRNEFGDLFQPTMGAASLNEVFIRFGKKFFFDPRFSQDKKMSCSTCHDPKKGFTDGVALAIGNNKKPLRRRSMSLYNVGNDPFFFWDGRVNSLEEQFLIAISHPDEMAMPPKDVLYVIKNDPEYQEIYPKGYALNIDNIAKMVAEYVRSIKAPWTKFDDWLAGDDAAMTAQELKGFVLFNQKANCTACHMGPEFTDNMRNDIGMADKDKGYGEITNKPADEHFFKTTGLRGIKDRAPYMHNGSFSTLEDVIEHYDDPAFKRGNTDIPPEDQQDGIIAFHHFTQPLNLTRQEKADLIAFLKSL